MVDAFDNNGLYVSSVLLKALKEAIKRNAVVSGLGVTEQAIPDMTVIVASGTIRADSTDVASAGNATLAINAAHATLDRYDLVTSNAAGTVVYTAGTASATAVPPEIPANSVPLAVVYVAPTVTTINTADIYDLRQILTSKILEQQANTKTGIRYIINRDRTKLYFPAQTITQLDGPDSYAVGATTITIDAVTNRYTVLKKSDSTITQVATVDSSLYIYLFYDDRPLHAQLDKYFETYTFDMTHGATGTWTLAAGAALVEFYCAPYSNNNAGGTINLRPNAVASGYVGSVLTFGATYARAAGATTYFTVNFSGADSNGIFGRIYIADTNNGTYKRAILSEAHSHEAQDSQEVMYYGELRTQTATAITSLTVMGSGVGGTMTGRFYARVVEYLF